MLPFASIYHSGNREAFRHILADRNIFYFLKLCFQVVCNLASHSRHSFGLPSVQLLRFCPPFCNPPYCPPSYCSTVRILLHYIPLIFTGIPCATGRPNTLSHSFSQNYIFYILITSRYFDVYKPIYVEEKNGIKIESVTFQSQVTN